MSEAMRHVTELADRIGPRPATTDAEARAADYIEGSLRSYGLDVSRQEFDCPRTYSWAFVIYHALTIASVVSLALADTFESIRWIAFMVSAIVAVLMWSDLDTRFGLSSLMPKGPSQNVIARHLPKTRRGDRVRKVVIVAHYDSAKASLAFAPAMVGNFALTFSLMKWCTFAVPLLIFIDNLQFLAFLDPYLWYATLVVAAYLLVPQFINIHRELVMRGTDGANDNASGVAALLSLAEELAPESDSMSRLGTQPWSLDEIARHENVPGTGTNIASDQSESELPDDFEWAAAPAQMEHSRTPAQGTLDFGSLEFESLESTRAREHGLPSQNEDKPTLETPDSDVGRRGFFGIKSKKGPGRDRAEQDYEVSRWLGVGKGFDARKEGKDIGHWDNFEDDDDSGTLGGSAGDDRIGDPEFPANEASRIRRRVTERMDRDYIDKEIWFVATGAEEAGTWGMRAFLAEFGDELKDAYFINFDNIGTGTVHWVTSEGMAVRYPADRRLQSLARKVSRSEEIMAKGRPYKGLSTDATPALARRFRAISIMAFDINGRLPNWHWHTDVAEAVDPDNIDAAVALAKGMIREL